MGRFVCSVSEAGDIVASSVIHIVGKQASGKYWLLQTFSQKCRSQKFLSSLMKEVAATYETLSPSFIGDRETSLSRES